MQILLIQADKKISATISFVVESNFSSHVTRASNLEEAIKALSENQSFGLTIYSSELEKQDLFKKFISYKQDVPSILIKSPATGQNPTPIDPYVLAISEAENPITKLCQAIQRLVDAQKLQFPLTADTSHLKFTRIPPIVLLDTSPLEIPIYIRLSETKYLKIFSKGDVFDQSDLERYSSQKGIEYFYVNRTECGVISERYSKVLESASAKLDKGEDLTLESSLDLAISTQELIQELASKLGYTDAVKQLINQNVDVAVKAMKNMPDIADLLARLEREKDRYIAAHSSITAFIACAMSKSMSFSSEATYKKLTMAAFLHDCGLQNQDLAMHRTLEEVELMEGQYTALEIEAYKNHTTVGAEIARQINPAVTEVDTTILQHHEFCDGKGFPHNLSALQVAPMAALFIIAHEFVLCAIEGSIHSPVMIMELKKKFSQGNFKQVFRQIDVSTLTKQK